jgi:hypothetical protein
VANVLARLPGREPGKSVLLMSHYDSVPAGPGASDDMTGVAAILEIARVLKAGPPPRHGVLLLFSDGEEAALLGSRAFVASSPAMQEVGAVVNLEARGSSGPSLMFETSGPDAWTVSRFASGVPRPFATSLSSTIYRYMANDTDLTVFKGRRVPGLNFAFIGEPSHYHTAADSFANASADSLQHHGDNALAAVRALADGDLARVPRGQAVYFDVFHLAVVRWRAGVSLLLGILALGLTLAAAVMARRRGLLTWDSVVLGMLATPAALFLNLVASFGLQALLARAFPLPWVARPLPAMAAFWLISLAMTLWTAVLLTRRNGFLGVWAGLWIFWALLGLLLGLVLPGVSYLFLVPALVAGVAGLAAIGRPLSAILPSLVAALLWFPVLILLYGSLGLTGLLATALLLVIIYATLTPLVAVAGPFGRRWLPLAATAAALVFAVVAMLTPPFSPQSPRTLTVQLHEDADSGTTRWLARGPRPLPAAFVKAGGFSPKPEVPFPWLPPTARVLVAPAAKLNAAGPELTVVENSVTGGKRRLRLRLTSPRGAPVGMIYVPVAAKLESIAIDGKSIPEGKGMPGDWRSYTNLTLPPQGSQVDVVLGSTQPMDWYVLDRSYGLPPSGAALLAARPKDAVPFQDGDVTVVTRKVRI